MADYKSIKGVKVQNFTTDPDNPITGQVWYNESVQAMKFQSVTTVGAWATGGNLNTGRYWGAGAGIQTAALTFGGSNPSGGVVNTESYNGASWTEVGDLNTGRSILSGTGTQTSALAYLGNVTSSYKVLNETWNGTSWAETTDLSTARRQAGSAGTDNTSALAIGGETPTNTDSGLTESWNGTSWTELADLNTARAALDGGSIGTNTASLAIAGYSYSVPGAVNNTESWNGTSWTEVGDTNGGGDGKFGDYTSAILQNGTDVQIWNGTSWAETTSNSNNLTARVGVGASSAAGLVVSGEPPGVGGTTNTEEWTGPGVLQTKTITSS